jgi:hypothetical protein
VAKIRNYCVWRGKKRRVACARSLSRANSLARLEQRRTKHHVRVCPGVKFCPATGRAFEE